MSENQLPWWNGRRRAGFRLSLTDAIIIVAVVPATWALWKVVGLTGLLCPVVLGHFFLFCNVFRVPRRAELAWAGVFIINACLLLYFDLCIWWRIVLYQSPMTFLVIAIAILRQDYHGLGWSKIRPYRLHELPAETKEVSDDDRI